MSAQQLSASQLCAPAVHLTPSPQQRRSCVGAMLPPPPPSSHGAQRQRLRQRQPQSYSPSEAAAAPVPPSPPPPPPREYVLLDDEEEEVELQTTSRSPAPPPAVQPPPAQSSAGAQPRACDTPFDSALRWSSAVASTASLPAAAAPPKRKDNASAELPPLIPPPASLEGQLQQLDIRRSAAIASASTQRTTPSSSRHSAQPSSSQQPAQQRPHVPSLPAAQPSPPLFSSSSSSSSPFAFCAPQPSTDPSDDCLREEGLHPRWSEWEVVAAPPTQSYEGYIEASTRRLPPAVLSAFRHCSPYPNPDHDDPFPSICSPTFRPPFLLYRRSDEVYGLVQHKLIATRDIREKEVLGFLGGHLGTLEDAQREGVDNRGHPSHLCIDRGYLEKYYEYRGAQAVVLSMKRYHSPLQHIRDPALLLSDQEEKRPELDAYNVNVDVALDPQLQMPVVVAYAWVPIEAGRELFAFLSLGRWYSRDHKRLFIASRVNHWLHRSVAGLERLLHRHNVDLTQVKAQQRKKRGQQQQLSRDRQSKEKEMRQKWEEKERAKRRLSRERATLHKREAKEEKEQPHRRHPREEEEERKEEKKEGRPAAALLDSDREAEETKEGERGRGSSGRRAGSSIAHPQSLGSGDAPVGPVLSALDEWKFLGDEGDREAAIARWNASQAAAASNRGMERVELYKAFALSRCTYVKKLFVGKSVNEDTRAVWETLPDWIPPSVDIDGAEHRVDPEVIRRLVENGHDEQLVELREVTSLVSPVRYYSVPWCPSFCVVARKAIKRGTFVLTYGGELEQEIRNPDSVYVYDMPADSVRAQWPTYPPDMPDLVIDAEKYGGVARFVNDSRYRAEEALGGAEGCTQNVDSAFIFIDHCIHLAFYTTRDVRAREELISHYGDAFWSVCTGQMLVDHRRYYDHITHYHQQLLDLCHRHSLPLPRPPSYLLEAEPLFQRKLIRYACEAKATDIIAVDEEWEVEAIIGKVHFRHSLTSSIAI